MDTGVVCSKSTGRNETFSMNKLLKMSVVRKLIAVMAEWGFLLFCQHGIIYLILFRTNLKYQKGINDLAFLMKSLRT